MEPHRSPASFHFETPPHVMIVEGRFYTDIADLQLQGVKTVLDRAHATYEVITVPGALEIPAVISMVLKSLSLDPVRRRCDGFVALGCVLKGGTHHDEIVAFESARSLQYLAVRYALAIGNGILTCPTKEQAMERADPARLNRSGQAAEAALRMIELEHQFRLPSKGQGL